MHDKTATAGPRVAVLALDGVELFELGAATDVFGTGITAGRDRPLYQVAVCGPAPAVATAAGFTMQVPHDLTAVGPAHTVIVTPSASDRCPPPAVLDALRRASAAGKRIISLCTGVFVLAAAGLLDGRTATTHWAECADLARLYPRVRVDEKVLYVDEGNLLTSAGSAASLDLCLHVVQRDYGTEIATRVARDLVVPLHRPGGQAQYIETPMPAVPGTDRFSDALTWLREHLAEPVTVGDLARLAAMSPRTFARRFLAATGTTPLQWILTERVRLAQRLLESTGLPVDAVARGSGFGTPDNLRKHFARAVRTTPQAYRRAFCDPGSGGVSPAGSARRG